MYVRGGGGVNKMFNLGERGSPDAEVAGTPHTDTAQNTYRHYVSEIAQIVFFLLQYIIFRFQFLTLI